MGNTPSSSGPKDDNYSVMSDREIARKLVKESKNKSVHFSTRMSQESDLMSMDDSQRSLNGGGNSPASMPQSPNLKAKHIRSNLLRVQQNKDPLFYYEIITVLGVGSSKLKHIIHSNLSATTAFVLMIDLDVENTVGSVAKVRKRDDVVGGSARRELVNSFNRQKKNQDCFKIPFIGGLFRHCLDDAPSRPSTSHQFFSAPLETVIGSNGLAKSRNYEVTYALKSIHLNRVTETSFVDELKNEIEILKSLDHPHIVRLFQNETTIGVFPVASDTPLPTLQVRPIETFVHRNQLFIVMELCDGGEFHCIDDCVHAWTLSLTVDNR